MPGISVKASMSPIQAGKVHTLGFVRGQVGFNDVETGRGLNGLMEGRDAY